MSLRTLKLPAAALAASVVLALSACDPTAPPAAPAGQAAVTAQAAAAPADVQLAEPPATGSPKVTLVTPAAGTAPTAPAAAPAATRSGTPGAGKAPAAAPPSPAGTAAVVAGTPDLKLDAYDKQTGNAVLVVAEPEKGAPGPSAAATASATATAAATAAVQPGRLIDSPPSAVAPQGALLAITDVKPAGEGRLAVSTRPATIAELLGQAWADLKTALDPRRIQVTPKVKDLKVSYVPGPDGGQGAASAVLQLDAETTVPLPGGAKASLSGSLALRPSVTFSYRGSRGVLAPEEARVGFDLGAHANWHLTAGLTGSTGQVRIPIATLTATPTVLVAGLPVVIALNTTVYAAVSADGTVSVDATQEFDGSWAVRADYTRAAGWKSATEPVRTTVSPVRASFTGRASVRTGLVAEGSVALYDALGVKATVEPYLRADVDGSVSLDSSGGAPTVRGKAGLYGGLDVNGAVLARIAILGTPLFEKDIPFTLYHREWPIATREAGAPAAAVPTGAATPAG